MDFNAVTNIQICPQIVSDLMEGRVSLLYYSHIPAALIALLMGIFVLVKGANIVAKIFFSFTLVFFFSTILNLFAWVSPDSRIIMFSWASLGIFSSLIYVLGFYFVHVFIEKKDIPFWKKGVLGLLILPVIILTPTTLNLGSFDLDYCYANDNLFLNYIYVPQIVASMWMLFFSLRSYLRADKEFRKQILLLTVGMAIFLLTFFGSGYLADKYEWYSLEIYGLFAMVVFLGFLAYLIVTFKAFRIQLLATQALVIALVILVGSQLLFTEETTNIVLIGITWILVSVLGLVLVRSVKSEIKRKEQMQVIAHELEMANEELRKLDNAKTEFLSIASHQLRTPLTAMKGYLSMLLEGSYGEISEAVKDTLNKVYVVNTRLARLVEELLSVSRIDAGRVQYNFEVAKLEPILKELADTFAINARERRLELRLELPKQPLPKLSLDTVKIKEVISNLVDNSLKYTKKGHVTLRAERINDAVEVIIEDTGIGISPETLPKLFEKFSRSRETSRMEVSGTGLGLYVGKKFVEAHGGTIRAFSQGSGLGSRFVVSLPVSSLRKRGG